MLKKKIIKALIIIGVIVIIMLMIHLIGGNLMNILKGHLNF